MKKYNMKKAAYLMTVGIAIFLGSCMQNEEAKAPETEMEKVSYSLGVNIASNVKSQGLDSIDVASVAKAFNDVFEENDLDISPEESGQILQAYFGKLQEQKQAESVAAGKAFLEENALKEGVTTTASGLQYEVITTGAGDKPTAENVVTVHYHGMLLDGTVFDSSVERGEPAQFGVSEVIPGWTEALQLMSIGDKWKLVIPSHLAYGPRGAGGRIGPNETLIFEVELLEIN